MSEPQILLEERSPHHNILAVVEQDERVAYLYLQVSDGEHSPRPCWIRNLLPAPEALDVEGMNEGIPPMLPRANCSFPQGSAAPDASRLKLVWFPEGDGVALLEDGAMLACIPSWAFDRSFPGYARDAVGQSSLCWGLEDTAAINERIQEARRYWSAWKREDNPWRQYQKRFLASYEAAFGKHDRYFAIDKDKWPPKALIQIEAEKNTLLMTLGVSLRPQPQVELYLKSPSLHRRFELAACLTSGISAQTISAVAQYLSAQARLPWERITFLGHGHTVRCDAFENESSLSHFTHTLLVNSPPEVSVLDLPEIDADPVNLLWIVPITAAEQAFSEEKGSKALLELFPAGWPLHLIGNRPPAIG